MWEVPHISSKKQSKGAAIRRVLRQPGKFRNKVL
jgi:hypothetical protein